MTETGPGAGRDARGGSDGEGPATAARRAGARDEPTISDNAELHRYEAHLGDRLAGFLDYRLRGERIVLVHTDVAPAYEGRGIGTALARYALEDARARDLGVVPRCPFVLAYLKRHPEYASGVVSETGCTHLDRVRDVEPSAEGCEDCLAIGATWVHLRLCLSCGHVGCCDSSPNRHASAHARQAGHPIVRSFEPGENWAWCYVDEVMLEPAPAAARSR